MRVHLVHAHPAGNSFVAAMRDAVAGELGAQGNAVTVSDLYSMGFNPVLSADDFRERDRPAHFVYALEQRHAFATDTLAPDIKSEVDRVLGADLLAFTFPVFWYGPPAILKGWIERVFLSGPFYGGRRIYSQGGLKGKRAFAAIALGGQAHMFGPGAIHGELETGMMRHFFQGTLSYVGLSVHQPFIAYHVPYVDEASRRAMLDALRSCVRALADRPLMAVPDLDAYDAALAPKGNSPRCEPNRSAQVCGT